MSTLLFSCLLACGFLLGEVCSQNVACQGQADILFILDSSASITKADYNTMINFAINITRKYNIGPNSVQFAAIVFGNAASLQFNFNAFTDHLALEQALLRVQYLAQTSYTDKALQLAREQAFTAAHGSRPNVPKIVITITDGPSTNPLGTGAEAKKLKDAGVQMIVIDVGTLINLELQTLASTTNDVFTVAGFNQLYGIQSSITNRTCAKIVPTKGENVICNVTQKADILFILDSSGSIGTANYSVMLNVVVDITRNFNLGPDAIQFASIIFGTDAQEVFDFRTYSSQATLERAILNTPYIQGWTYTDKALRLARERMFTAAKGSRPGVQKIAIVFTDGQSNNKTGTQEQSTLLKNTGVLVLSIGIGNGVEQAELETIASVPDDVFEVSDFGVLNTIQNQVTNKTCQQVTAVVVPDAVTSNCTFVRNQHIAFTTNASIVSWPPDENDTCSDLCLNNIDCVAYIIYDSICFHYNTLLLDNTATNTFESYVKKCPEQQYATCNVTQKADILFILDSSGSIGTANYSVMLNVVVDITRNFNLGPNGIQFASIIFGTDAQEVFDFTTYSNKATLERAILNTPYIQGWTYTDKALRLARERMFTAAKGSRPGVQKIAIVFTDGQSNNKTGTQEQSTLLKNTGVLVLSVGIGNDVEQAELETIASVPDDVFEVSDFGVLNTIQNQVTNKTCQQVTAASAACNAKADILFIVDSSDSIHIDDYNEILNVAVNLTRNFNVGPQAFQFGSVIFSNDAQEAFDFTEHTNHTSLEQAIRLTPYLQGRTNTDKALQLAREQIFTTAKGSRPNVPKIVIVFTNGNSSDKLVTKDQAQLLRASGALLLAIGVGDSVNDQELQTIASLPNDVFTATSADVLNVIEKEVIDRICERATAPVTACEAQADILFIMDSSGSILIENYKIMLNFVVDLTRNFNVGPGAVQFGSIIFSDLANEVFDFRKHASHSSLEQGILSTPYLQGATFTGDALQLAREKMFTGAKGSRPDVPKIAIVLTDGLSSNPSDTAIEARLLKNSGVLVLSIGIGNSVNKQELETIASLPQDVFQVKDFSVLDTIQQQVTNKTCERVTEEQADCPAVADILFIMDSTGSISENNYKTLLTFVANFTRSFAIGPNWAQFSVITFADSAYNEFGFTKYTTHSSLEKGILNATYFGDTTQTDLALKMAREQSFTSSNGARSDVDKIAIVLTDGRSNDPERTAQEAKALKDSGVLVITVAIGKDILSHELNSIATLPEDVFHVDHFNALESIEKEFTKQTCSRVTQTIECEAQADILFILDSSASVGTANYAKMLYFLVNVTRYFDLGPKAVQFSAIIFGDDAHLDIDFGKYSNHLSLEQGLLGIDYLGQNTFTNKALMLARLQAFTAVHGARGNVSKIAIVFTDGQSSLPTETTREAQLLKESGVLILSVGIGDTVKVSELQTIATLPTDVFQVTNFDVLQSIQKSLANRTCEKVTGSQTSTCTKHVDVIFLLDASGSVSIDHYREELTFAANFTNNFQLGEDSARFGAVIFSDNAIKLFDLDDFSDHVSILRSLLAAPHLKGGTNTADALEKISRDGLFNIASGGRLNATKMLFIMTDGQSSNITHSIAAAQQLKDAGVQILTIGVGDVVNVSELKGMATSPGDFFQASSYEVLHQLQDQVTNHTCGFIKPSTPTRRTCSELADILFVFDSSTAITADDYQKQLLFASNVTQDFDLGPVDAQFAAVAFSNDVYKVFDLGQFSDYLNLFNGLLSSPHLSGSTDTGLALNWIVDSGMLGPAYGGRYNASKIIILFIDNPSNNAPEALSAANRLKNDGVHIAVVGVNNYDLYEIRQIATDPQSAFKATSSDALYYIQRDLVDDVCDFASTGF